ncbi:MAG: biotin transport system substrate-specific component [Actinomycetota bacterium]|jgi:biotin transport system substrate-specific component|nr:biotin transport system substrate-specific component [Actinomycetota bacterium]
MTAITAPAPTLADAVFPRTRVRDALLVVGFAGLTALAAQLTIKLPFTPVPITGQTFAVLATGTALGWRRGLLSQLLYVVAGLGLPIYAGGAHGWAQLTGASGGYLVGFVVAAALVGLLSERRQDRSLLTSIPAMLAGSAVIYAFGLPWLAHSIHVSGTKAAELGLAPFLIGDTIKLLLAAGIGPAAWRFVKSGE